MSRQLGRISGPLLKDNLLREGINLAFHNDSLTDNLLYLDVTNKKIGIKSVATNKDLYINGTFKTTNALVDTRLTYQNLEIEAPNFIRATSGPLNFSALGGVNVNNIRTGTEGVANYINFDNNVISTVDATTNLVIDPTGTVEIISDLNVTGNIHATGNISADGNIIFGNNNLDSVTFNSDITSNIVPDQTDVYSLGTVTPTNKRWNTFYATDVIADSITAGNMLTPGGVDPTLTPGKIWFVSATSGIDTALGNHQSSPFRTISKALSVAMSGDEIHIYPGIYEETFPLTVPAGVMVRGQSLRSVTVKPTLATNTNDAFLLHGETTVSDITVTDFYEGYAFRFASGAKTTTRSPYVQNVTVITRGSIITEADPLGFDTGDAGKGALVDGSVCAADTYEAAMLFHSVTFITPGVDALTMTNGVRVEWLNSFTYFANRSLYATNGYKGLANLASYRLGLTNVTGTLSIGDTVTLPLIGGATVQTTVLNVSTSGSTTYIDVQGIDTSTLNLSAPIGPATYIGQPLQIFWNTYGNSGLGNTYFDQNNFRAAINNGQLPIGTHVWVSWQWHSVSPQYMGQVTGYNYLGTQYAEVIMSNPLGFTGVDSYDGISNLSKHSTNYAIISPTANGNNPPFSYLSISSVQILTGKFGAEIRSIASASVYGNYGAYADGDSTLMYLIQYNFGYIGAGKDKSNDLTLVVQDNEVTELNSGKIYYQSVDQSGTFRVGDTFYADFRTGTTSINVEAGNLDGLSSITLYTGQNSTYIDAFKMDVGNFVIRDNTLLTGTGTFNIVSANGEVYLDQNVAIAKNLAVTGNINVDGTLTFGNQTIDNIIFNADINSDLLPKTTDLYTVGTITKRWDHVYLNEAYVGDLTFKTNTILPATLDNDLLISANGSGIVSVPTNSVTITNNLTVNSTTATKNIVIVGAVEQQGNTLQTGAVGRIGNTDITGNLTVSNVVQFQDVKFNTNTLTTTLANNDLRLVSAGTKVYIPSNNVVIDQNLRVDGTSYLNNLNLTTSRVTADEFATGDIVINDNYITTSVGNNNLELRAAGTGKIYVPFDDVKFDKKLAVNKKTTTKSINITGNIVHVGDYQQTGNIGRTGNTNITGYINISSWAQFEKIRIENNVLSGTALNTDLRLVANGTGKVIIPNNNTVLDKNLTVGGTTKLNTANVTQTVTANAFTTGDVYIDDNYITTTVTNSNLELLANGTGKVYVPLKDVQIVNDFTVNGTTALKNTVVAGTITHVGTVNQTGTKTQTGNTEISGTLGVTVNGLFPQVTFIDNKVSATLANTDLRLTAAGTGRIYVPSDNVRINQALTVAGTTSTASILSSGTITANRFTTGDIVIDDNYAITTVGNNNLELSANGTGYVAFEKLAVRNNTLLSTQTNANIIITPGTSKNLIVDSTTAIKLPVGTTADRVMSQAGELRFSTTDTLFSGYSTARRTMGGVYSADRLTRASAHPTNNTITFTAGSVATMDVLTDRLRMNGLDVNGKFLLNNNTILNTVTDENLTLNPSSEITSLNSVDITGNYWINNLTTPLTLSSTADGYVKFTGTNGLVISAGTEAEKPTVVEIGMVRFNTDEQYTEIYDGTKWIPIIGEVESATMEEIVEIGDLWTLILG